MRHYLVNSSSVDSSIDELFQSTIREFLQLSDCAKIKITRDSYGKPHCNLDKIYISASNSGNHRVVVVSSEPVGIDCEEMTELSSIRLRMIYGNTMDEEAYYQKWTKLESISKLFGKGLTDSIDQLESKMQYVDFENVDIDDNVICNICFMKK